MSMTKRDFTLVGATIGVAVMSDESKTHLVALLSHQFDKQYPKSFDRALFEAHALGQTARERSTTESIIAKLGGDPDSNMIAKLVDDKIGAVVFDYRRVDHNEFIVLWFRMENDGPAWGTHAVFVPSDAPARLIEGDYMRLQGPAEYRRRIAMQSFRDRVAMKCTPTIASALA